MFREYNRELLKWIKNRADQPWNWKLKDDAPAHIRKEFESLIADEKELRTPKKDKDGFYHYPPCV